MTNFSEPVILGRTGLKAGRLGISSSYGAPAAAFEEAFERGCNYFVMGSFMKGRSKEMIKAIHNIRPPDPLSVDQLITASVSQT